MKIKVGPYTYERIVAREAPEDTYNVPRAYQGQIVEYAFCAPGHRDGDIGDPYMRVTDASDRTVRYYRLKT